MSDKMLRDLFIFSVAVLCFLSIAKFVWSATPNVYDEILYQQDAVAAKQTALQEQAKKIQQQIKKLEQDYVKVLNNLYYVQGAKDILKDVENG